MSSHIKRLCKRAKVLGKFCQLHENFAENLLWVLSADSVLWIQIGIWYVSWMPFYVTIIIEAVMVGHSFKEYIPFMKIQISTYKKLWIEKPWLLFLNKHQENEQRNFGMKSLPRIFFLSQSWLHYIGCWSSICLSFVLFYFMPFS